MSSYYHAFVPGFNWWYIVAPVMVLVVGYVGTKRFRLTRSLKIKVVFNDRLLVLLSVLASVVFGIMLVIESMDGIIQLCDNALTKQDSPAWTLFTAPFVLVMAVFSYGSITYFVGRFMSYEKYSYLCRIRRIRRDKETTRGLNHLETLKSGHDCH